MKHTESPRTSENAEKGPSTHDRGIPHEQTVTRDSEKGRTRGLEGQAEVQSTCCSSRGSGPGPQHSHGVSQQPATLGPGA